MVGLTPAQITSSTDLATPSALASGTPPLGSFGGSGFDKVNLYNGNVNFSIPVASLGGRNGLGVTLSLSYNSKVWRVENDVAAGRYGIPLYFYSFVAGPYIGPGWMLNVGSMIRRQSSWLETNTIAKTLTNITFTAPDGTQYDFRDDLSNGQPFSLPYNNERTLNGASRGFIFHTSDGTSATFISKTDDFSADLPINDFYNADGNAPAYPSGFVLLRNGTRFKVFRGKVVEQQDSNGNIVRFLYNGNQLTQIIDTLGRSIDVAYANSTSSPIVATITTKGVGGVSRVTEIRRKLLGDSGVLFGATMPAKLSELFPDLDTTGGSRRPPEITFNPSVITEISLPDDTSSAGNGHKWEFKYNAYGEIAKVFTPSNGAIEYSHAMTPILPDPGNRPGPEIFRRVLDRKVYASKSDSTPRSRTTYSDPTVLDSNNNAIVTETTFNQSGQRLAVTQHKFVNSPADNYGVNLSQLKNTGYRPWMEGKEIQTEEIELNAFGQNTGRRRITSYFYEQREGVSWVSGANESFLNQPENDPRLVRVQTQLEDGSTSKVDYEYDLFNNVTLETVTGFNNQVLRKTQRSYLQTNSFQSGINYRTDLSIHLRSLLLSETIIGINPVNGLETIETSTTFEYDRYSSSPLVNLSFSPLDNSRNPSYGSSYQTRGNVTSIIRGLVGNQSIINTQYDIAGNVLKTQGPLATQEVSTTYDSDHFAFPIRTTQVVPGAPSPFVLERTYDLHTGVILSSTGFNKLAGEVTNYFYNDPLDRLTRVVRPSGTGQTEYTYSPASNYPNTVTVETSFDNSSSLTSTTFYDGLLNPIRSTRFDPQGNVSTETTYDGLGRVVKITNPQRGTASVDTSGSTETTYNGLGRVLSVESFDKNNASTGKVTSSYDGPTVTVTDQAGKQRRSLTDALGRLISVFEPDDSGVLSLVTNYSYDARGNLLRVSQGIQNRTFVYDSLGRLTSATAPESGTTTYIYDSASNLISRTDARNITTTFTYDALNRVKTKNYSDSTPSVSYFYDGNPGALPTGATLPPAYQPGTALGRLVAVATPTTARQSATGSFYTYDVPGRIISSVQLTEGGFFANSATYNQASLIEQHTYPSQKVITNTYQTDNGISNGQLDTVSRDGQTLSSDLLYNAAGALEQQKLGNELFHTISYNSRLQPTTISLGSAPSGISRSFYWSSNYEYGSLNQPATSPSASVDSTKNNGNIARITLSHGQNTVPFEQQFSYDNLNRLSQAAELVEAPAAPTNFQATLVENGPFDLNAVLSWSDNSDDETGFIIEVLNDESQFVSNGFAEANQTSISIGVSYELTYCYRVRAIRGSISSDPSGSSCVTTPTNPCRPCSGQFPAGFEFDCECFCFGCNIAPPVDFPEKSIPGFGGDGKSVAHAQIHSPSSLALHHKSNSLYFADSKNSVVRKIDDKGIISSFAGRLGAKSFEGEGLSANKVSLGSINSLAVNQNNQNLYIALNDRIVLVDSSANNKVSTIAGSGLLAPSLDLTAKDVDFGAITSLSIDKSGNLFFTSSKNGASSWYKLSSDHKILSVNQQNSLASSQINRNFTAIAVDDSSGDIYLADSLNNVVLKVDSKSNQESVFLGGGSEKPKHEAIANTVKLTFPVTSLAFNQGSLYVVTSNKSRQAIYFVDKDLKLSVLTGSQKDFSIAKDLKRPYLLLNPTSIALTKDGNFFVSDKSLNKILFFNQSQSQHWTNNLKSSSNLPSSKDAKDKSSSHLQINPLNSGLKAITWSQDFVYDRYGNRFSVTDHNNTINSLSIDSSNNRINDPSYEYDAVGNLIKSIRDSSEIFFFYDAENRLIAVSSSNSTNFNDAYAFYSYDGNGRRVRKFAFESILFVYDLAGRLISEYNSFIDLPAPAPEEFRKEYVFGASGLLATFDSNQQVEYLTPDHLGSPRIVTGEFANVVSRRDFHPFGEDIEPFLGGRSSLPGYDTFDSTRQRFTGYEKDLESGLDFAQARYYSSNQARFTSPDPLLSSSTIYNPQTWNHYSYVTNNPLKYTDPTGLYIFGASLGGNKTDSELISGATSPYEIVQAKQTIQKRNLIRQIIADLLNSGDQVIEDAAKGYGTEGVNNNVIVEATDDPTATDDGQTNLRINTIVPSQNYIKSFTITVTLNTSRSYDQLLGATAHEGQHIIDNKRFIQNVRSRGTAAINDNDVNLTTYDIELRGYIVTAAVAMKKGQTVKVGQYELHNVSWSLADGPALFKANVDKLLKSNYTQQQLQQRRYP